MISEKRLAYLENLLRVSSLLTYYLCFGLLVKQMLLFLYMNYSPLCDVIESQRIEISSEPKFTRGLVKEWAELTSCKNQELETTEIQSVIHEPNSGIAHESYFSYPDINRCLALTSTSAPFIFVFLSLFIYFIYRSKRLDSLK